MIKKEESKNKMYLTDMIDDGKNHQRLNAEVLQIGYEKKELLSSVPLLYILVQLRLHQIFQKFINIC